MPTRTTHRGWTRPAGGDAARIEESVGTPLNEIDADVQALDEAKLGYDQGPLASRPTSASGTEGRLYYATDDAMLYYDFGGGWIPASFQPGDLRWSASVHAAPTGWLWPDGRAVSRVAYAALFARIGTAFGAGNGTTTFNLPDLRGRVAVGVDGVGLRLHEYWHLGQSSGSSRHTLTVAEMPSHAHGFDRPARLPVVYDPVNGVNGAGYAGESYGTHNAGSSHGHNNMPPYLVLNVWIKT